MFIAVAGFVFPHTMQSLLDETFTDKIITSYREDPDLQNLIDFGQKKVCIGRLAPSLAISVTYFSPFLQFQCCGLSHSGFMDWQKNEYFNCSSPSVESCGVPFSCCINATSISVSFAKKELTSYEEQL